MSTYNLKGEVNAIYFNQEGVKFNEKYGYYCEFKITANSKKEAIQLILKQYGTDNYGFVECIVEVSEEKESKTESQENMKEQEKQENKKSRRTKYEVFTEKWNLLCNDKELVLNRHDFVLSTIALLTSRKENRDIVNSYQLIKGKKDKWHIKYNNLIMHTGDASTIYGWCIRTQLNYWVQYSESLRSRVYDSLYP